VSQIRVLDLYDNALPNQQCDEGQHDAPNLWLDVEQDNPSSTRARWFAVVVLLLLLRFASSGPFVCDGMVCV
jgi:hypothetical protein